MTNVIRSRKLTLMAATLVLVLVAAACQANPGDYTGDGKADLVGFDANGNWYLNGQSTPLWSGPSPLAVGSAPAPADYSGGTKVEPGVVVGTTWYSSAFSTPVDFDPAGMPAGPPATPAGSRYAPVATPVTLVPVPGNYNGTGKAVPAWFDQVDDSWWISGRSGSVQFGTPPAAGGTLGYSVAVPGDWDGDGTTDIAVYDPPTATFRYLSSKSGQEVDIQEGQPGDFPVPADYDAVGHMEAAVTDWNETTWCVAGHAGAFAQLTSPSNEFIPAQADYDGNAHSDPALFDAQNGDWDLPGQPPVATSPAGLTAAVVPWSLWSNFARLTLYTDLSLPHDPTSCAAG